MLTSAGSAIPLASGTFTVPIYSFGPQIAEVIAPDGSPLLLGWLDETHQVISAETTAEVMAYIALGGPLMFQPTDRTRTEAAIVSAGGLSQLTGTITSELQRNPDAFASNNANLQTALDTFFKGISGVTPRTYQAIRQGVKPALAAQLKPASKLHPQDANGATGLLITPGDQSGVEVNSSQALNAINTVNTYRRRTHVFVQQVSDTDASGQVIPDTALSSDFELSPTVGLSAGVTGGLTSIFNYYYGAGTTAYAPVTSDDVSVPVTQGFSKSTYRVTVVGAGASTSTYGSLPANVQAIQLRVAIGGFVEDALVPLFSNLYFGSGFQNGFSPTSTPFEVNWAKDIESDIFANEANLQSFFDEAQAGDWGAAMSDVIDDIRGSGTFRSIMIDSLKQAAAQTASSSQSFVSTSGANLLNSLGTILGAAGGVLQVFDTSVYVAQLAQSDSDDEWTVVNGGVLVNLTPSSTTMLQYGAGVTNLTTSIPGSDLSTGYSFRYTDTANGGSIAPADGSQAAAASFCSSDSQITYAAYTSPVLTQSVTDTISVTAYQGGNCQQANALGKAAVATVTVRAAGPTISPESASITQSGTQTFNGYLSGSQGTYSMQYTLSGSGADGIVGVLTDAGGSGLTGTTLCLSGLNTNVVFTPNASPILSDIAKNAVSVSAFSGSRCSAAQLIGSSVAVVNVGPKGILLQPRKSSTPQTDSIAFSAILESAQQGTTYSYLWSAGTQYGVLSAADNAGTTGTFCSPFNEALYKPTATPGLTAPVSDTVSVQAFTGSDCNSNAAFSTPVSTPLTITPVVKNTSLPLSNSVQNLLQASDGNYYASSSFNFLAAYRLYGCGPNICYGGKYTTNTTCAQDTKEGITNPCGQIYRISRDGTQTLLHTFANDPGSPYQAQAGLGPVQMQEGPNGNLYGLTYDGYFFEMALSGQFAILNQLAGATRFLLGSDGFFYVTTSYSVDRVGVDGSVTQIYQFPHPNFPDGSFTTIDTFLEGADGDFYGSATNYSGTVSDTNLDGTQIFFRLSHGGQMDVLNANFGAAGALLQAADGNFYTTGEDSLTGATQLWQYTPSGVLTSIYTEPDIYPYGALYAPVQALQPSSLFLASDGNIYGTSLAGIVAGGYGAYPLEVSDPNCVTSSNTNGPNELANCNGFLQLTTMGTRAQLYTFPGEDDGIVPEGSSGLGVSPGNGSGAPLQNNEGLLVGATLTEATVNHPNLSGTVYQLNNNLPAPVQLSVVQPGTSTVLQISAVNQRVQLKWAVLGAYSMTSQQCYAFVQSQPDGTASVGAGTWTGKQTGATTANAGYQGASAYTGSYVITPTLAGTYTYALTCGGRQSGFATLTVQ